MSQEPVNNKLYAMVVMQAKAKYRVYPSPGASHWVHKRYLELGGKFIDSEAEAERKKHVEAFVERKRAHMSHQFHGKRKKEHGDK